MPQRTENIGPSISTQRPTIGHPTSFTSLTSVTASGAKQTSLTFLTSYTSLHHHSVPFPCMHFHLRRLQVHDRHETIHQLHQ